MSGLAHMRWLQALEQLPNRGQISKVEVAKHNQAGDCWIVLDGHVYDVSAYVEIHPSDPECILSRAGTDLTAAFMERHRWISPDIIQKLRIGVYVG